VTDRLKGKSHKTFTVVSTISVLFKYRFGGKVLQAGSALARANFSSHGLELVKSAYGAEASRDKNINKFRAL